MALVIGLMGLHITPQQIEDLTWLRSLVFCKCLNGRMLFLATARAEKLARFYLLGSVCTQCV